MVMDGWKEGRINGLRGPEKVGSGRGYSKQSPTPSSLASGARRGVTDYQGQGGAWADPNPVWGSPVNIVDSQHC